MSTQAEPLLAAEAAVQDLLKNLTDLKTEVGGYAEGGKVLMSASARLDKLIDALTRIAIALSDACDATRKISTVEILAGQDRISRELAAVAKDSVAMREALMAETRAATERLESVGKRLHAIALWAAIAGTTGALVAIASLLHR